MPQQPQSRPELLRLPLPCTTLKLEQIRSSFASPLRQDR